MKRFQKRRWCRGQIERKMFHWQNIKIEDIVHANISQIKTASFQCVAKNRITHKIMTGKLLEVKNDGTF